MSERYARLFALPENLYAVGSPVLIAAGTLLKDTQTGKIIAQLKLKSISAKAIKAVKVKLDLFDTAGNGLAESVVHDYLDLNIARDVEFGQKNPVMVPNVKARSYKAAVTEVVFADRSVWTEADGNWEPLSKPSRLAFADYELQKQYEIKFGGGSMYEAKAEKDLWHCTCGALNRDGEMCHICHNTLLELQNVDMLALEKEKDARLAEESRIAEEKARELAKKQAAAKQAHKRTTKILKIVIPIFGVLVAAILWVIMVVIPNNKYEDAVALMDAGHYNEAIVAFSKLNGYKDSSDKLDNCQKIVDYEKAMNAFSNKDYTTAKLLFKKLGDYQDSKEKIEECYIAIYGEDIYKKISSLKVGDQVELGRFEQDNNSDTTDEAIVWNVIATDKNSFLLLSDKILIYKRYDDGYSLRKWEQSASCEWLNDTFYFYAFNDEERKTILSNNPSCTKNVFLLSNEEAANVSKSVREAQSTKYASATNNNSSSALKGLQGYWALRTIVDIESPTIGGKHYLTVNKWGDPPIGFRIREEENEYDIGDDGLNCDNFCVTGIRPAIWVSLDAYK